MELLKDFFNVKIFDKLIEDNRHHISVNAWIGTTMFIALFVLAPVYMFDKGIEGTIHAEPETAIVLTENIVLHAFTPLLFFMSYGKRKKRQVVSYKHIGNTMIWPLFWLIMILSYSIPTGIWPYYPTNPDLVHIGWVVGFFMLCAAVIATNAWFLIWRTKKKA